MMDNPHFPSDVTLPNTRRQTVAEVAESIRRANEEQARIYREWPRLSAAERRDEGIAHELYCTLCGVPFWVNWLRNVCTCKGDEDCFAWVNYFLARE